ncbi:amidase family protein [Bacillus sp. FSL K6-0067]|uniref:amidase family protein n=1 Tax=Bacillus sp. FSL K6-0067 TaxID=2921412 RepID=UPI00077A6F98|nr:amidase family protein [Bacillus cereus]KXY32259.1 amidase [Bacillus cereus]
MNLWIKKVLVIVGIALVSLNTGGCSYFYKNFLPEKRDSLVYDKERVLAPINKQLEGINLENIKKKEQLIINATVDKIQQLVDSQQLSYEELTSIYLLRIKEHDQNGLRLNAVTEINPHAIEEARKFDKERVVNKKSHLYGIPVIVKDNIQTANVMPTSAGTYVLKDWIADKDATIVKKLKKQNALILGKANMSEWAYYLSDKAPSGYSGKKGQNLNPYGPTEFDPLGSSSGSATVVASDFASLAIGTETAGSIVAPASVQSVIGLRPTLGLVSRMGIIPLSETLDTAGPMARNVKDTALLFNTMVGYDERDSMTKKGNGHVHPDYAKDLSVEGLKGKRIGILFSSDQQDTVRKNVVKKIIKDLQGAGAILIENIQLDTSGVDIESILEYDFKHNINNYLASKKDIPVKTLKEIIMLNEKDARRYIKYGQAVIKKSEVSTITKKEFETVVHESQTNAKKELNKYLENQDLDALVMINNEEVLLSAVAGYPELSVPAGYDKEGKPIGATFIGKPFGERELFQIGYAYEQQSKNRRIPKI